MRPMSLLSSSKRLFLDVTARRAPVATALLAAVVGLTTTGSGCATIGSPPLDEDLIHDGSPEASAQLSREYRVVYEDGTFRRPGTGEPGSTPSSPAFTDESYNYIASSPPAREVLDHSLTVRLDRATRTGVMPAILALGIPVVATAGAGAAFAWAYTSSDVSDPRVNPVSNGLIWGSAGGAGALLTVAFVWALTSGVLYVTSPFLASGAYREAANTFNDDLRVRIERSADPTMKSKIRVKKKSKRIHRRRSVESSERESDDDDDANDVDKSDEDDVSSEEAPITVPDGAPMETTPVAPDAPPDAPDAPKDAPKSEPSLRSGPVDPA